MLGVGQEVDDIEVYTYTRQRAEAILPTITAAMLLNSVALAGVTSGIDVDWHWWTTHIREPDSTHQSQSRQAVRRVVQALPDAPLAVVATAPAVVTRLVPFLAGTPGPRLASDLDAALSEIEWTGDADAPARRSAGHGVARALAPVLSERTVAESLSKDVMRGVGLPYTEELRRNLIMVASGLDPAASQLVDDALTAYETPASETAFVLRLRLIARGRYGADAPEAEKILDSLDDATAPAIVDAWLTLRPPVTDAAAVLIAGGQPRPAAVESYSTALSLEDRTQLWSSIEEADVPLSSLEAVGKAGVDASALQALRQRLKANRQQDRDAAVERMLTVPLDAPAMRVEVSEAALELLGTSIAGNAALAARLVTAAGGAGRGYTVRLRERFDAVEADNGKTLSKTVKQQLIGMNVLTKQKKSRLDRVLGR